MASRSFIDYLLNPGPDEVELQEAIRSAAGVADDIAAAFVAIDAAVAATAADVVTINAQVTYIDGVVAEFNTDAAAAIAAIATDRAAALAAIATASTTAQGAIDSTAATAISTVNTARDDAVDAADAAVATIGTAVTTAQAALEATGADITTDLNIIKAETEGLRDEAQTARDEAVGAAAAVDLPPILPGDSGKSLRVKATEDGFELSDAPALPAGGVQGQYLVKASSDDQDAEWADSLSATEAQKGVIELATSVEARTGTDTERAMTPATTKAVVDHIAHPGQLIASLTSGVPVTQSDVAGATNVYVIPLGDGIGLYDGTDFINRPTPAQIAVALTTGAHPGGDGASGRNFDVFAAYSGGAVVCGTGPSWEDGGGGGTLNARGTGAGTTEVEFYRGRFVNKNSITLTNGATTYVIPARQALLVATFRTTANGQTEDSAWRRYLSNAICPQVKVLKRIFTFATYDYSATDFRLVNNDANNRVRCVQSLAGRPLDLTLNLLYFNSTTTERTAGAGIGINGLTDAGTMRSQVSATSGRVGGPYARLVTDAPLGFATLGALERGAGADVQSWFSSSGSGNTQTGLAGLVLI